MLQWTVYTPVCQPAGLARYSKLAPSARSTSSHAESCPTIEPIDGILVPGDAGKDPPAIVIVAVGSHPCPFVERRECRSARTPCGVVGRHHLVVNPPSSWTVYEHKACQHHVRHVCPFRRKRGRGEVIALRDGCVAESIRKHES